ncbi:PAS domain-containing sensor histidine kinase [Reichenbachiella sp. MALMAid0571]|uniref:PAS domain-containing sensor histidine kinase n=1 Tax=Reichenbachiella sp. MALMAid0571 TaxID=3143939 RepID=UPI0032DF8F06
MSKSIDLKHISKGLYNLDLFFELSPDILCIAGYDGYFKKINPAVSKLLGYSNEELFSRPINDFVHEEDKRITADVRFELTKSNPLYNFENRYIKKNGEVVWLSWTSYPVEKDQLIFAIAKNVTHRKNFEEERNSLLTNLTNINKELKQLTYTTSHDLRSPINNLLSVFNLLDITKIKDKQTIEIIEMMKSSSERLRQTINNYVDTISTTEQLHAYEDELDLKESLDIVVQSIDTLVQTSGTTINSNFSELEKIRFNHAYLKSIFQNLITNSIKYSRPDCPPVISIYSKRSNGVSQIIISDNGMGFDMDKVKGKIFGLHQKFHDHKDSKGIGLYLVYSHVTSLGGHIDVKSKINEGTEFTITFKV